MAVASACGVTRLADVTGLDRIGIPVWQAVRPWSWSLSVHQGKGLDAGSARLGALMEAIESHFAEQWRGPTALARYGDLPATIRLPQLDDLARRRGGIGDEPLAWTPLERLDGGVLLVPEACVSLDLTRAGPAGLERSSNGQAAHFDLDSATAKGLCELIERDAAAVWGERGAVRRLFDLIKGTSIPYDWFGTLAERLRALGVHLLIYRLPAVIEVATVACAAIEFGGAARAHRIATGSCAACDAEAALRGAVLEALQSRLTGIAGSRDDIDADRAETAAASQGLSLPPPPGFKGIDWSEVPDRRLGPAAQIAAMTDSLARAGYPLAALARLSPPECPVVAIKAFVPGLALKRRLRRAAA